MSMHFVSPLIRACIQIIVRDLKAHLVTKFQARHTLIGHSRFENGRIVHGGGTPMSISTSSFRESKAERRNGGISSTSPRGSLVRGMNISGYSRPFTKSDREDLDANSFGNKACHNADSNQEVHTTAYGKGALASLRNDANKSSGAAEADRDDEPLSSRSKRRRKPTQIQSTNDPTDLSTPQERPGHDSQKPPGFKYVGPACTHCNKWHKRCNRGRPCSSCENDRSSQCSGTSFRGEEYRTNDST